MSVEVTLVEPSARSRLTVAASWSEIVRFQDIIVTRRNITLFGVERGGSATLFGGNTIDTLRRRAQPGELLQFLPRCHVDDISISSP